MSQEYVSGSLSGSDAVAASWSWSPSSIEYGTPALAVGAWLALIGLRVTEVVAVAPWLSVAWKVTTNVWFACAAVGVQVTVRLTVPAGEGSALRVIPAGGFSAIRLVIVPSGSFAVTVNWICCP